MFWTKILTLSTGVLAVGALGSVLAWQTVGPKSATDQPASSSDAKVKVKTVKPDQSAAKADSPKPEQKTYKFEVSDMPWAKVLEWYSVQSGLPLVIASTPAGTFSFHPRQGRQYTLEEITDILNEALLAQKYILVRRADIVILLEADGKIDPTLLPRVQLDDLEKRGQTELVRVVVPLTALNAKEVSLDIRKMLGLFGKVVVLETGNQLILQDMAGNLRLILQIIKDTEAREAEKKQAPKGKQ
jgi:type II secretory pathway component GspD/PulD (secretin)